MKVYITEYDDGRKCVAYGNTEETAQIITEDVSEGNYYKVAPETLPEMEGLSVLDPFGLCGYLDERGGYFVSDDDEPIIPLHDVLAPAHKVVDLYAEQDGAKYYAKGVLVNVLLDTGEYDVGADGIVHCIE